MVAAPNCEIRTALCKHESATAMLPEASNDIEYGQDTFTLGETTELRVPLLQRRRIRPFDESLYFYL